MPDPIEEGINTLKNYRKNNPVLMAPSDQEFDKILQKPPLTEAEVREKASKQGPITFPAKIPAGELFENERVFKRHEDKFVYLTMIEIPVSDIASFMNAFQDQFLKQCLERKEKMEKRLGRKTNNFDSLEINLEVTEDHKTKFLNELFLPPNTHVTLQGHVQNANKISIALVFQKPPAENLTDTLAYVNIPDPSKPKEISINISPEGKQIQESWKAEVLKYQKQMREFNAELASLKKLALSTSPNPKNNPKFDAPSENIKTYSSIMIGFDFEAFFEKQRNNFNLPMIAVADIGGGSGTAAFDVEKNNPHIQTFVIDPFYRTVQDSSQCPAQERFFVNKIEDNIIPDNSFHALMSVNSLSYTNVNKALEQVYRILKPGGVAALEYEFWNTNHANFEALPDYIKNNLTMEYRSVQKGNKEGPFGPFDFKTMMRIRSEELNTLSYVKSGDILNNNYVVSMREELDSKYLRAGRKKLFPVFFLTKPKSAEQEAETK